MNKLCCFLTVVLELQFILVGVTKDSLTRHRHVAVHLHFLPSPESKGRPNVFNIAVKRWDFCFIDSTYFFLLKSSLYFCYFPVEHESGSPPPVRVRLNSQKNNVLEWNFNLVVLLGYMSEIRTTRTERAFCSRFKNARIKVFCEKSWVAFGSFTRCHMDNQKLPSGLGLGMKKRRYKKGLVELSSNTSLMLLFSFHLWKEKDRLRMIWWKSEKRLGGSPSRPSTIWQRFIKFTSFVLCISKYDQSEDIRRAKRRTFITQIKDVLDNWSSECQSHFSSRV